jgi:ATP-dependent Clp protease ATP-binding subunit ClpA
LQDLADVVIQWQRQLLVNNPPQETVITKDKKAKIQQLYQQIKALEQQVQQDEQEQQSQQITQLLLNAQQQKPQLEAELQSKGLSLDMLARNRQAIKAKLSNLSLSYENLDKLLDVLVADKTPNIERKTNDKTDLLQRSLDILQQH